MNSNTNSNPFIDGLKGELDSKKSLTENGAVTFATSGGEGKCLVDFNFDVSSMRGWDEERISSAYAKAFFENPEVALRYWAFCADCRGGLGERRTSRIIFKWLVDNQTDYAKKLLPLIPFYGRWDSLVMLIESNVSSEVIDIIVKQLKDDLINCRAGKSFSLLSKWCPSQNTSSPNTRRLADILRNALEFTPKQYRKMLSELRSGLKIVERSMSSKEWSEIDYSAVPSKANILYRNAFMKHDENRRKEFLDKLSSGDKSVKINSSAAFPCDIVHAYMDDGRHYWRQSLKQFDQTIEEMWKSQKDYLNGRGGNTMVVADTSGSMCSPIGSSSMSAWEVAQSLAIYFSERASGPFKDKYIMFSSNPFFVDFSNCKSLRDRIALSQQYNECSSTDFYKTMMLILDTAVKNNLKQEDIPNILVVSDCQFDMNARYDKTLMEEVEEKFHAHGYSLPQSIVYWNITGGCNRGGNNIPMQKNDDGRVGLLSGFSPAICDMVFSQETSPYKILLEKLNSSRYDAVSDAISKN